MNAHRDFCRTPNCPDCNPEGFAKEQADPISSYKYTEAQLIEFGKVEYSKGYHAGWKEAEASKVKHCRRCRKPHMEAFPLRVYKKWWLCSVCYAVISQQAIDSASGVARERTGGEGIGEDPEKSGKPDLASELFKTVFDHPIPDGDCYGQVHSTDIKALLLNAYNAGRNSGEPDLALSLLIDALKPYMESDKSLFDGFRDRCYRCKQNRDNAASGLVGYAHCNHQYPDRYLAAQKAIAEAEAVAVGANSLLTAAPLAEAIRRAENCGRHFNVHSCSCGIMNDKALTQAEAITQHSEAIWEVVKRAIRFAKYRTESAEGALRDRVRRLPAEVLAMVEEKA